jgi:c(7)-type cytochrome triheme protein
MKNSTIHWILLTLGMACLPVTAHSVEGSAVYTQACASCHDMGVAGAQKYGDASSWQSLLASGGVARLYKNAVEGTSRGMPAKGGAAGSGFSEDEVKSAVDFMLEKIKDAPPLSMPPLVATASTDPTAIPFTFNRLLRPLSKNNPAPTEDGIHDPSNEGTKMLQPPTQIFDFLPRSNFGNRVDWVAAVETKKLTPRWDKVDSSVEGMVMDMNILRVPRGSMPNVIFPHKQHTEWLECSNCHPAIFVPQRGANQISMPLILLGQKCGVCHGKVSFPISECRKCHSQKKDEPQKTAAKP